MSIANEITRLQGAKNTLKTKLNARNDAQHQIDDETIDEFGDFVDSIPSGGGGDASEYFKDTITAGTLVYDGSEDNVIGYISGVEKMLKKLPNVAVEGTDLSYAFYGYQSTTIPQLNTSNVTNMKMMFYLCNNLTTIPQLNTSSVTNMSQMFERCSSLTGIPELNTSNVTNMEYMFSGCRSLITIPSLDVSDVEHIQGMFENCSALTAIPELNILKVENTSNMFNGCRSLTTISTLNMTNVVYASNMFGGCEILTTIPQLNTSNVTQMDYMFRGCSSLTTIPALNTSSVEDMYGMFEECNNLSNESLNNILAMCINAENYLNEKVLSTLGINTEQTERCKNLSNYQAFLDAGWSLTYPVYVERMYEKRPPVTRYTVGEWFDPSEMVIHIIFTNGEETDISSDEFEQYGITYEPRQFTEEDVGDFPIIEFVYEDNVFMAKSIEVFNPEEEYVKYLKILQDFDKTQYVAGEYLDLTGLILQKVYSNGNTENYDSQEITELIESGDMSITPGLNEQLTPSKEEVQFVLDGADNHIHINVIRDYDKELTGLRIAQLPSTTTHYTGEYYDESGLELELTFNDESTLNIDYHDFDNYEIQNDYSGEPFEETGEYQIKYYYMQDESIYAYVTITVIAPEE